MVLTKLRQTLKIKVTIEANDMVMNKFKTVSADKLVKMSYMFLVLKKLMLRKIDEFTSCLVNIILELLKKE